jgi:hypothetical protein
MTPTERSKDLIVLAADNSMGVAIAEVLERYDSLGIRRIFYTVIQHSTYDSGVLQTGHRLLAAQSRNYQHALAICDHHGCGKETLSREKVEAVIEKQLSNHWGGRAAAIVINPELENWVWSDSPHVAYAIEWKGGMASLRTWLQNEGLILEGQAKPKDPKTALEKALWRTRKPKSAAIFQAIASKVSLSHCTDPAFLKLGATLRSWFPAA